MPAAGAIDLATLCDARYDLLNVAAVTAFCQDLTELSLPEPVDAIFSNATFHWIPDHAKLFAALAATLKPGGQLVAQCGGFGNIDAFRVLADEVAHSGEFAPYFSDWKGPWNYARADITAERLTGNEVELGSEFSLVARFLGNDTQLTYRIVEYEPPRSVVFLGENDTVISRDRITFEPEGTGTNISYDAELTLKGPRRIADPLLGIAFKRVGDRALAGMREALAGPLTVE